MGTEDRRDQDETLRFIEEVRGHQPEAPVGALARPPPGPRPHRPTRPTPAPAHPAHARTGPP
ncbi:hypothetical protein ACFVYK_02065, partial [Streptomyces sp. NPDC058291]